MPREVGEGGGGEAGKPGRGSGYRVTGACPTARSTAVPKGASRSSREEIGTNGKDRLAWSQRDDGSLQLEFLRSI